MIRCSAFARHHAVEPIGTAPSSRGVLLVEWPMPWPRDVREVTELRDATASAKERGVRVQLVGRVAPVEHRAVVLYVEATVDGLHAGYRRSEWHGPRPDVAGAAAALLATPAADADLVDPPLRDVLVCTHGSRDRCCGAEGTRLFTALHEAADDFPGTRIWRTSHLGGHRFAPTVLVLPDGTSWAHADFDVVRALVRRDASTAVPLANYRGSIAVGAGPAQVAERLAFDRLGWGWLDVPRAVAAGSADDRFVVSCHDGSGRRAWEVVVRTRRRVPTPPCGQPPPAHPADAPEYELAAWKTLE